MANEQQAPQPPDATVPEQWNQTGQQRVERKRVAERKAIAERTQQELRQRFGGE